MLFKYKNGLKETRAGARYTEFLKAHYGESPRDERLQRPEYIGGSKSPVIISEVLQTSSTDVTSPQGNLAGHGMAVDRTFAAKYHAQEFGLIMGIMSIMPSAAYQQGIDRQWLRRTKFDFYFPEFANLSEQAIEMAKSMPKVPKYSILIFSDIKVDMTRCALNVTWYARVSGILSITGTSAESSLQLHCSMKNS